jgi:hypothetical protein
MAVIYARELTRWGIETSIVVPGAFTGGTSGSGSPALKIRSPVIHAQVDEAKRFSSECGRATRSPAR